VSASDPNVADQASQRKIIEIPHPVNTNHVGGQVAFGPDGYLYLATGDGGSGDDPPNNAQNTKVLLGKLLRIDPRASTTGAYRIPPDNPYVGVPGKNEIYAIGLRNPFRFSFDHATGDLVIGDVGQNVWEEIDFAPPGAANGKNFGWNVCEGKHQRGSTATLCTPPPDYLGPTHEYQHNASAPHLCGITGGFVSRDNATPELLGKYLYSDICDGTIRSINAATGTGDASTGLSFGGPYSFGQDGLCHLYAINGGGGAGSVLRIDSTTPGSPGCATA
jgi:hypothetical protein